MSRQRTPVAAGVMGSVLLLAVWGTDIGTASAASTSGQGCVPSVIALPLPDGMTNGDVLSATPDEAVGYVADDAQHQHVAVWHRTAGSWTVEDLGDLGITEQFSGLSATGIGPHGLVSIGVNTDVMGAWVYLRGAIHPLKDFAGGTNAYARAASPSGEIVGEALDSAGNDFAAIWRDWRSAPRKLAPVAGYDGSFAQGVDAHGDVVGGSFSNGTLPTVAVRWTPEGRAIALSGLGADAQAFDVKGANRVVGTAGVPTGQHAVVWNGRGTVHDLGVFPGSAFSRAIGTSSNGDVVGFEGANPPPPATPIRHVLFWTGHGAVRSLLPLSLNWADGAYSHAVDARGDVFGASAVDSASFPRPTEWTCARAQSFVPPRSASAPSILVWPRVAILSATSPAKSR